MDVGAFLRFATLAKCPVSLPALPWNGGGEREGGRGGRTPVHHGAVEVPMRRASHRSRPGTTGGVCVRQGSPQLRGPGNRL